MSKIFKDLRQEVYKLAGSMKNVENNTGGIKELVAETQKTHENLGALKYVIEEQTRTATKSIEISQNQFEFEKKIQEIKAQSKLDSAKSKYEDSKNDLKERELIYQNYYRDIIDAYSDGIMTNLSLFFDSVKEEVQQLRESLDETNTISDIVSFIDPRRDDDALVHLALSQYEQRVKEYDISVMKQLESTEEKMREFIMVQRSMIENLEKVKIRQDPVQQKYPSSLSIVSIPVFVTEIMDESGNVEYTYSFNEDYKRVSEVLPEQEEKTWIHREIAFPRFPFISKLLSGFKLDPAEFASKGADGNINPAQLHSFIQRVTSNNRWTFLPPYVKRYLHGEIWHGE